MGTDRSNVPWEAIPGERGYFCVKDDQGPLVQGEALRGRAPEIHVMGDAPLVVDKLFGPLAFQCVRITADIESGDWIVERETTDDWEQVARFAGQTAEFFGEDD